MIATVKPGPWSWHPTEVEPEFVHLASRARLIVPFWPGRAYNLVDKAQRTVQDGSAVIGRRGYAWRIGDNNDVQFAHSARWSLGPVSWSICVAVDKFAAADDDAYAAQVAGSFSANEWRIRLATANANILRFNYHTGASRILDWASAGTMILGDEIICITRQSNGVWRAWRNGRYLGQVSEPAAPTEATTGLSIGGEVLGGGASSLNGDFYAVYIWRDYALEDADAKLLSADPFGIIRPVNPARYYASAVRKRITKFRGRR